MCRLVGSGLEEEDRYDSRKNDRSHQGDEEQSFRYRVGVLFRVQVEIVVTHESYSEDESCLGDQG